MSRIDLANVLEDYLNSQQRLHYYRLTRWLQFILLVGGSVATFWIRPALSYAVCGYFLLQLVLFGQSPYTQMQLVIKKLLTQHTKGRSFSKKRSLFRGHRRQ